AATVKTTPLVVYSCDPFAHVTRLARPDGNLTGVTCMTTELSPKRLELLKEAVPKVSRVMFLHDPEAAPNALKLTEEAAPRLGIRLQASRALGRASYRCDRLRGLNWPSTSKPPRSSGSRSRRRS